MFLAWKKGTSTTFHMDSWTVCNLNATETQRHVFFWSVIKQETKESSFRAPPLSDVHVQGQNELPKHYTGRTYPEVSRSNYIEDY